MIYVRLEYSINLVRSVNAIVVNDEGSILMAWANRQRELGGTGRAIDLGESVAQAAVRETLKESGIECEVTGSRPQGRDVCPWYRPCHEIKGWARCPRAVAVYAD